MAPPDKEFRSLLERAGVSRRWRLVAAVLMVVLAPIWFPALLMALALAVKGFSWLENLAELETWLTTGQ